MNTSNAYGKYYPLFYFSYLILRNFILLFKVYLFCFYIQVVVFELKNADTC